MPLQNQAQNGLCYVAWDTTANTYKTGDVGNHTLRLVIDGIEAIPNNNPTEVDSANAPGLYKISLTTVEMSGNIITLAGKSSTANIILIPTQISTQSSQLILPAQRSSGQIWSDSQLDQWAADAIGQISILVNCIFVRECVPTQVGVSVITLPSYVRTVRRITWRGKTLTALNWDELMAISPAMAFLSPNAPQTNIESSQSTPLYYGMHPTNPYDVRFYPTPSESFTISGELNPYAPQVNTPSCIVDFYRVPDLANSNPLISLPPYILRRTLKAYVAWKAFEAEGKGQDLRASAYYKTKFNFLIESFRAINDGAFVGKRYSLEDGTLTNEGLIYPRPTLPTNFETVRLR